MKNIKLKILLAIFLLVIIFTTTCNASFNTVTMSVVEEPICTISLGANSLFEKRLYSKDLKNKEVTLQLKIVNNEANLKPTGEIMLVIDNSKSMIDDLYNGKPREDLVINSAQTLITNLLKDNTKLKIGAVSFSSNIDISKEGTIEDAKLISDLTNDSEALINSITNIEYNGPRTNLDAGITLAKDYFTDSTDKSHRYIIVLSDGVPNIAIDYNKKYYSDDVIQKTKNKISSLSDIMTYNNIIVMLTGVSNGTTIATPSTKTYDEIINEIFGTPSSPTIGKFYYITDDKIEQTITNNIYKDLLPISQSFTDIKLKDYFPEEIVNNFDFAYVESANIGEISTEIDKKTNSITWTIPELKSGETAIVQYKLKLIEDFDEKIVNKILNTNKKVDLTYTDFSDETNTKTSDVTPKLKLTEPEPEKPKPEEPKNEEPKQEKPKQEPEEPKKVEYTKEEIKKDEESRPTILPKAGKGFLLSIPVVSIISIILGIKYYIIRKITK